MKRMGLIKGKDQARRPAGALSPKGRPLQKPGKWHLIATTSSQAAARSGARLIESKPVPVTKFARADRFGSVETALGIAAAKSRTERWRLRARCR